MCTMVGEAKYQAHFGNQWSGLIKSIVTDYKEEYTINFCRPTFRSCNSKRSVSVCLSNDYDEPIEGVSYVPAPATDILKQPTSVRIDLICDPSVKVLNAHVLSDERLHTDTNGERYDISGLRNDSADYRFTVKTNDGNEIVVINFCRDLLTSCDSDTKEPAVNISWNEDDGIAADAGAKRGISYVPAPGISVFEETTTVRIDLICNPEAKTLKDLTYKKGTTADDYIFTVESAYGCPRAKAAHKTITY
ncbi:hypothetical protein PROFUN_05884 [Planoprotostelium fungivorum]|uniref:MRH domain-containing protein n=1 Tax=Planoprotostelium fungivorum TaxID=1890364 RepID=A0A2P6NKT5_9EUKA|nr:hypothetical protein PROFUN_05884 [Planoprotostelium fungivorum]